MLIVELYKRGFTISITSPFCSYLVTSEKEAKELQKELDEGHIKLNILHVPHKIANFTF